MNSNKVHPEKSLMVQNLGLGDKREGAAQSSNDTMTPAQMFKQCMETIKKQSEQIEQQSEQIKQLQELLGVNQAPDESEAGDNRGTILGRILQRLGDHAGQLYDHDVRIDHVEDQSADPEHLPNLILCISAENPPDDKFDVVCCRDRHHAIQPNKWFARQLVFAFVASIAIQAFQILLAIFLMEDGKSASADLVGKWIAGDLLEWNCPNTTTCPNGTSADAGFAFESYSKANGDYEIGMLEYAEEKTLTATRCDIMGGCGVDVGISNVVIGLIILGTFIVKDASAIFFINEYRWNDPAEPAEGGGCILDFTRPLFALVIILGQIATNVIVAVACGTKIVTSSLDLPETLSAAIEAFFILEIDDALLPFLTFIVQPKVHALRKKENFGNEDDSHPTTCLDCAKRSCLKGNGFGRLLDGPFSGFMIVLITTPFLVMLIAPVVVTVDNSVLLYGSE